MEKKIDTKKAIFAVVGIIAGLIIAFLPAPAPFIGAGAEGADVVMTQEAMRVIGVLVWAIIYWVGGVLPEAITGMLMATLFVVLGKVPMADAFNAFSGSTIWLVIGACMLGAAFKASGLLERVSLLILKVFPKNLIGRSLGLMISTFVVGPFIPSTMAKTTILAPMVRGISETAGYEDESKPAHALFLSYWTGLKSCSTMFITASVVSVALVGMLPEETAAEFGGLMQWAVASLPAMIPFLVLAFLAIVFLYCGKKNAGAANTGVDADYVTKRLAEIGGWNNAEKITGIITILTVIAWLTKEMHGVPEWAAVCAAATLLVAFKVIDINALKSGVPWPTIVFVGVAISIAKVFSTAGISTYLQLALGPATAGFFGNPFVLVIAVAVFTYVVRFVIVSESGFLAIATAILFPLCLANGVNPWIVAIILNAFTNTFQLPYQSSLLIGTVGAMGEGFIKYSETGKFNVFFCLAFLVAFLIATPIWLGMGIFYI